MFKATASRIITTDWPSSLVVRKVRMARVVTFLRTLVRTCGACHGWIVGSPEIELQPGHPGENSIYHGTAGGNARFARDRREPPGGRLKCGPGCKAAASNTTVRATPIVGKEINIVIVFISPDLAPV